MNIIFEPIYDNVRSNAMEKSAYLTLDGVKQLVSFDGEVLLPFVIDETWPLKYIVKNHDSEDVYENHPYLVGVLRSVFTIFALKHLYRMHLGKTLQAKLGVLRSVFTIFVLCTYIGCTSAKHSSKTWCSALGFHYICILKLKQRL